MRTACALPRSRQETVGRAIALRCKRWAVKSAQAEWNRVFYASAPMGAEAFFTEAIMRRIIDKVKDAGRAMREEISCDVNAVYGRDPASKSKIEILLTNQGVHAILIYRIAHLFQINGCRFCARVISQVGRFFTGIEIHPSAKIGKGLLIDHGMGVVIGETAIIGDGCTLFHGVTLGGTGKQSGKRHPTLHDGVFVGAGAKVLGNVEIGSDAKIGANAVVLCDVPQGSTAVGVPARIIGK